ncbi:MAG: AtpZ/AtpI family protein [Thermoguttaceae bacterium]
MAVTLYPCLTACLVKCFGLQWGSIVMAKDNFDHRPPMAIAIEWSARLMTIGLEMAIPPAGGYWLDLRFGTLPVFVILGAILGFVAGMLHLLQIARQKGPR